MAASKSSSDQPAMQSFLESLVHNLGTGSFVGDVRTQGKSVYNELALAYNADMKTNSGSASSGTARHFNDFSCAP
jgi:hypothetical protein